MDSASRPTARWKDHVSHLGAMMSCYREYRHPDRQAIFVGDLIDRGDEQLQVLQIAKDMVDAGSAQIVMGNHELRSPMTPSGRHKAGSIYGPR